MPRLLIPRQDTRPSAATPLANARLRHYPGHRLRAARDGKPIDLDTCGKCGARLTEPKQRGATPAHSPPSAAELAARKRAKDGMLLAAAAAEEHDTPLQWLSDTIAIAHGDWKESERLRAKRLGAIA